MQSRSSRHTRYQTLFIGNCFCCRNIGHKAVNYRAQLKNYPKENRFSYRRNDVEIKYEASKKYLNPLSNLSTDYEFQQCGNHRHMTKDGKNKSTLLKMNGSGQNSRKF